ncbi:DUF4494 domain-containing protein [Xanthovirga aplysinae]|uniref:DUF4494 domain-containing protein n=1 Tax=Xanthovirga aplysinae TaxID=2529853 RepID=UPI0012BC4B08|nr:DUF4494 domain-containing protein [Xanthovirga aplysinae]MTI32043.1 DUF4494 domain-containing protein [Xanthovirga aplysinae]
MKTWFLCKVKYLREDDKGLLKSVTEPYLVDAMSFTEAEARIYEEMSKIVRGDFTVPNISKSNIVDIFHYEDADVWHKCKVSYVVVDDESGKEKRVNHFMIVTAKDVKEAYDRIHESLNNMLVTFRVPEVVESPIVEVFPYISDEEKEEEIPDNLKPVSEVEAETETEVEEN